MMAGLNCDKKSATTIMAHIVKKGLLTKRGAIVPSMKRRCFALYSDGTLRYFADESKLTLFESNPNQTSDIAKGSMVINTTTKIEATSGSAFNIITRERTMFVVADSESECAGWMEALRKFI